MARSSIVQTQTVHLELSTEEAVWLRNRLQNYMGEDGSAESPASLQIRGSIFSALPPQYPPAPPPPFVLG